MAERVAVRGLFETHLTVSDLARSIAFYRDLLGFNVAYERGEVTAEYMPRLVGIPGARLKIAGLDIPGLHLDLIEYIQPKGASQAGPPNDVGNVHIGFTVDDMWAAYNAYTLSLHDALPI